MTRPPVGTVAPVVSVDGAPLSIMLTDALIGLTISLGLRIAGRARLTFLDDGFAVSASGAFSLGSAVVVKAADGAAMFTGEVTGVELDVSHGAPNMTVIADDASFKLTLGNKIRTFTDRSYSSIVQELFEDIGMKVAVTASQGVQNYVLQADSDFGFLGEICDRAGYDWWVDPSGVAQFHPMGADSGSVPELRWESTGLLQFSVRASGLHPQQVSMNGWNSDTGDVIVAQSPPVSTEGAPSLVQPYLAPRDLQRLSAVTTGFQQFAQAGDGNDLASSSAASAVAGAVTAEGTCGVNPAIQVGHRVRVTGVGPASGEYAVTEVEHVYREEGFLTRFVAGERRPTSLVDTLSSSVPSSFRASGLVVGVVTNLGGSGPAPIGHVKVRYPTLGEQVESAWARVVALGAGASRGMTFLPEVNDEVIVGFEGGDVSRPVVFGGLYSGKNAALDYGANEGKVARRQIVSRLGHVIELGDGTEDGDQRIGLTLAGGAHSVVLAKTGLSASVPSGKPVSVQAGDTKIDIDAQGNITLSGQKITIKATQDVEISGMNVTTKATTKAEVSAMQVKVSGSASTDVSSGGITAVKGSMVKIN